MYKPTKKYKEYLVRFRGLKRIGEGSMCKGVNPATIAKPSLAHLKESLATELHSQAFAAFGKSVVFPEPDLWKDSSDDYAKKMVASGDWEQIIPDRKDYREQLQDHDILTWAFSEDGEGGCNDRPGMDGGNTCTGFLIEASGGFPVLTYGICANVPSGVFPLDEVLTNQKIYGSGLKAKLIYIHRWIG